MTTRAASTALGALLFLSQALSAQTFTSLISFNSADGNAPESALVQGLDGNFYGAARSGGPGVGLVFKITPGGMLSTFNSLACDNFPYCPNGAAPMTALILAANGNFYGTTTVGGIDNDNAGTVFQLGPRGSLKTLYSLQDSQSNSPYPNVLVQATNGNFYGTTYGGGQNNYGTIFEISPSGIFTELYSFTEHGDGGTPTGGLVQGTDGNLYGASNGFINGGAVFYRITPTGTFTVLHTFTESEGNGISTLIQASDGNFYGTAYRGGNGSRLGTVFQATPAGGVTVLHQFCSEAGCPDGGQPYTGVIQGTDGNFYGATATGGAGDDAPCNQGFGCGIVFKLAGNGELTALHSFDLTDGMSPYGLVQGTDGSFYGVTAGGGTNINHYGTIYNLSVGLAPFVRPLPPYGKVANQMKILGTNLAGTSAVTFNGVSAAFTIVSATEITATVPAGATNGAVQVTTPNGTLPSNVPFRVFP